MSLFSRFKTQAYMYTANDCDMIHTGVPMRHLEFLFGRLIQGYLALGRRIKHSNVDGRAFQRGSSIILGSREIKQKPTVTEYCILIQKYIDI